MEKAAQRSEGLIGDLPGIVFMGTPDFALPSLKKLSMAGAPVLMAVTQPDRPKGRGKKLLPPPVKVLAEELGIRVFQPERVREDEAVERIAGAHAECAVVVAYGQILPRTLLDSFPLGALNVHASVLPKYRGAAPIHRSILEGDAATGVSIMLLDSGMDTGPVLSRRELPIAEGDTFGTIHDRLALLGADLLIETLVSWKAGRIQPRAQDNSLATYAPPFRKGELRLDWSQEGRKISNRIRAFDPWPGAFAFLNGRRVKCFKPVLMSWKGQGTPGEILGCSESGLAVLAGDHQVVGIGELQLEGQRRMSAAEFLRGRSIPEGTMLE
jgi:methionyl-tRNA formyltransferase